MVGKLMKAVQYKRYGGGATALKHVEIPIPSPESGEVLLKVEAISLNPIDWKLQKGVARPFLPKRFPFTPGTDVAGEVVMVGPRVEKFKPGDKVVALLDLLNGGGLAEFAVASEKLTVVRPPEVSAPEAAGLPIAAVTALKSLKEAAGLDLRANVLVTAASGGVGHYAVQLAKKLGNAHVTATCGTRNVDLVKSLGADEVIDYTTPEGASLGSPSGKKYDAVIHCANGMGFSAFSPHLSENGKVIDLTPGPRAFWTWLVQKVTLSKKQLVPYIASPKAEEIELMVSLVKQGVIRTVTDSRHELSKAEDGWTKSLGGHATGKIIVEP
ncbi:PREDICTED: putative quinone-oxidoreductase homolog, chloroplastic [Tarenaya hassleriana]|uniref:putative quinone-oxidoreductase homolog, chloroplastic n=1 Tax=Tarenaya hassleriana TaxID=28532 RepID=UPI00053C17D2|nr:PREDICTED: putative quinone-oxidoreductase homolog, chloroplastic [Tarenaya hassleriana]